MFGSRIRTLEKQVDGMRGDIALLTARSMVAFSDRGYPTWSGVRYANVNDVVSQMLRETGLEIDFINGRPEAIRVNKKMKDE